MLELQNMEKEQNQVPQQIPQIIIQQRENFKKGVTMNKQWGNGNYRPASVYRDPLELAGRRSLQSNED